MSIGNENKQMWFAPTRKRGFMIKAYLLRLYT